MFFMKKYLQVFKISFFLMLEHRGKIIAEMLVMIASAGSLFFLWNQLTNDFNQIGNYNVYSIITYYLLFGIFGDFLNKDITSQFETYVKEGELVTLLQKPLSISQYLFWGKLGIHASASLISFVVSIIPLLLIENLRNLLVITPFTILWAITFRIFSHLFLFCLYWVLGCLAFWLTNLHGVRNVTSNLFRILEGQWFPFDLAPIWFQKAMSILPFQYAVYFPIQIVLGKTTVAQHIQGIIVLTVSTIFIAVIGYTMWKRGLKSFDAVGQ